MIDHKICSRKNLLRFGIWDLGLIKLSYKLLYHSLDLLVHHIWNCQLNTYEILYFCIWELSYHFHLPESFFDVEWRKFTRFKKHRKREGGNELANGMSSILEFGIGIWDHKISIASFDWEAEKHAMCFEIFCLPQFCVARTYVWYDICICWFLILVL